VVDGGPQVADGEHNLLRENTSKYSILYLAEAASSNCPTVFPCTEAFVPLYRRATIHQDLPPLIPANYPRIHMCRLEADHSILRPQQPSGLFFTEYTDKKENKIFIIYLYKEIQMG
jgi:hypothetical protein